MKRFAETNSIDGTNISAGARYSVHAGILRLTNGIWHIATTRFEKCKYEEIHTPVTDYDLITTETRPLYWHVVIHTPSDTRRFLS